MSTEKHGSDGLLGYESMRCANDLDGCDDRACICRCHDEERAPEVEGSAPTELDEYIAEQHRDPEFGEAYDRAVMLEAATRYCLQVHNYPEDSYASPEARRQHIENDAKHTLRDGRFLVPYELGIAEGRRQAAEDLAVLAVVGRMYLDALDADPEHEMLTLPEAFMVTQVREAVERQEERGTDG